MGLTLYYKTEGFFTLLTLMASVNAVNAGDDVLLGVITCSICLQAIIVSC